MGIQERKEREKEEARRKIIEVAGQLFLQEGAEKISMRRIAKEVEYSPAFLYLLFKDKNDLLFHVHEMAMNRFNELLESLESTENPVEDFKKKAEAYLRFAREEPHLYELMFILKSPLKDMDLDWPEGNRAFTNLENLVSELIRAGHLLDGDAENLSLIIWSTLHGLASLEMSGRLIFLKDRSKEEAVEASLHQFFKVLFE